IPSEGLSEKRGCLSALLPPQSSPVQNHAHEPISYLCATPDEAEILSLSRRCHNGAGRLSRILSAISGTGGTGSPRTTYRCAHEARKNRGRLLLQRGPSHDPIRAAELYRRG